MENGNPVISEFIQKFFDEYKTDYDNNEPAGEKNKNYDYFINTVKEKLGNVDVIKDSGYKCEVNIGNGRLTLNPQIRIYDEEESPSSTKGVYIVYILSSDGKNMYLTLNQGCDNFKKGYSNDEIKRILVDRANAIRSSINRSSINSNNFKTDNEIFLGEKQNGPLYEAGCVYYKKYSDGDHLIESNLEKDLNDMALIYKKYLSNRRYLSERSYNRIIYGAPGTGKSYFLKNELVEFLWDDYPNNYERVTFHPDYSYANFVGSYKPKSSKDKEGNDILKYEFIPGPFIRIYNAAIRHEKKKYVLIIEEINRAMVSSVFGDIFQLLDRNNSGSSEYPIAATEELKNYLDSESKNKTNTIIRIPNNLYIWATMNSADQGVYPLDTAFKRRWEFEYISVNPEKIPDDEQNPLDIYFTYDKKNDRKYTLSWDDIRIKINKMLISLKVNEDKLLGYFFISKAARKNPEILKDEFKNKVLMYLYEDVAKHKKDGLFKNCTNTQIFSQVRESFEKEGFNIFDKDFQNYK